MEIEGNFLAEDHRKILENMINGKYNEMKQNVQVKDKIFTMYNLEKLPIDTTTPLRSLSIRRLAWWMIIDKGDQWHNYFNKLLEGARL